MQKTVRLLDIR